MNHDIWPPLPYAEWRESCDTLHMWTQIVGKVRMVLTPPKNHFWHTALYVSPRGLTTSNIPYGSRWFDMEFDFIDQVLRIRCNDGPVKTVALRPRSVADFYRETMAALAAVGVQAKIWTLPSEFPDPIPFEKDEKHHSYDPESASRFWRILAETDRIFRKFESSFIGKSSPVHFFWGSFDLASTRFSGRTAPPRPDADSITREAYSHEVSSVGFWPGDVKFPSPAFYAYAAPEPPGYKTAAPRYDTKMSLCIFPYDDMRRSASPEKALLEFCQAAYEAAANLGKWDRAKLERS
jgi:hypothetical protein